MEKFNNLLFYANKKLQKTSAEAQSDINTKSSKSITDCTVQIIVERSCKHENIGFPFKKMNGDVFSKGVARTTELGINIHRNCRSDDVNPSHKTDTLLVNFRKRFIYFPLGNWVFIKVITSELVSKEIKIRCNTILQFQPFCVFLIENLFQIFDE